MRPNVVQHLSQSSQEEAARSRYASTSNDSKIHDRVASWVTQQQQGVEENSQLEVGEEPSPLFSPIKRSHSSIAKSVPTPSTPLPPVADLFHDDSGDRSRRSVTRLSGRSDDEVTLVGVEARAERTVSSANCARLQCLWQDLHVDSCRRRRTQLKCSQGKCSTMGDFHALWLNDPNKKLTFEDQKCRKLNFYCNGKKLGENNYQWHTPETLDRIKVIPSSVTDGSQPDLTCEEDTRVVMRLLSRRSNLSLSDPRRQRRDYPSATRAVEASKVRAPARYYNTISGIMIIIYLVRLKGWAEVEVIFTWSAQNLVKPSRATNHHVEEGHDDSEGFDKQ